MQDQKRTWNGIGSWGGSLGYTCSNANPPYDGLVGAYLGLGIDEFGNFINGVNFVSGYTAPTGVSATGDNTALGYGYVPGRIGLRGAGNVSWAYLNASKRLGVVDLFACEIGTLCRVSARFPLTPGS